jgi:hypothetical protein
MQIQKTCSCTCSLGRCCAAEFFRFGSGALSGRIALPRRSLGPPCQYERGKTGTQ